MRDPIADPEKKFNPDTILSVVAAKELLRHGRAYSRRHVVTAIRIDHDFVAPCGDEAKAGDYLVVEANADWADQDSFFPVTAASFQADFAPHRNRKPKKVKDDGPVSP